jgi:hypothetical protein
MCRFSRSHDYVSSSLGLTRAPGVRVADQHDIFRCAVKGELDPQKYAAMTLQERKPDHDAFCVSSTLSRRCHRPMPSAWRIVRTSLHSANPAEPPRWR